MASTWATVLVRLEPIEPRDPAGSEELVLVRVSFATGDVNPAQRTALGPVAGGRREATDLVLAALNRIFADLWPSSDEKMIRSSETDVGRGPA